MYAPYFLKIHYKGTRDAIATYIINFNTKLKETDPNNYKRLRIKSSVLATIYAILEMYAKSLEKNAQERLLNTTFRTNNVAIKTKMKNLPSISTIKRHITLAKDCGIFIREKCVWHGTNAAYELYFNSAVLVAEHNPFFAEAMGNYHKDVVNKGVITEQQYNQIYRQLPEFSKANNGCISSIWAYNEFVIPNKNNINMLKALSVENNRKKEFRTATAVRIGSFFTEQGSINSKEFQEQGNINSKKLQEQGCIDSLKDKSTTLQNGLGTARIQEQNSAGPREKNRIDEYIARRELKADMGLRFAKRLLFKDRKVTENDIAEAREFIKNYYKPALIDGNFKLLEEEFELSIMEAYKSKKRTLFQPAPLYMYFDPMFTGGFYRTLEHVQTKVKPYLQKNQDYTKSFAELRFWHEAFLQNNGYETYRKATQALAKKRNKIYLEVFNELIAEGRPLDSQAIQKLR